MHARQRLPRSSPELSTRSLSIIRLVPSSLMRALAAGVGQGVMHGGFVGVTTPVGGTFFAQSGCVSSRRAWQTLPCAPRRPPARMLAATCSREGKTPPPPSPARRSPCVMMRRMSERNCPGCCASSQYKLNMSYKARRVCGAGELGWELLGVGRGQGAAAPGTRAVASRSGHPSHPVQFQLRLPRLTQAPKHAPVRGRPAAAPRPAARRTAARPRRGSTAAAAPLATRQRWR